MMTVVVDADWPFPASPCIWVETPWGHAPLDALPKGPPLAEPRRVIAVRTILGEMTTARARALAKAIYPAEVHPTPWPSSVMAAWAGAAIGTSGMPMDRLVLGRRVGEQLLVTHVQHRDIHVHGPYDHVTHLSPPDPSVCASCARYAARRGAPAGRIVDPWRSEMRALVEAAFVKLDALEERTVRKEPRRVVGSAP